MWILLFLALLSLLFLALDVRLAVRHYRIPLRGIKHHLRIVLLADHHSSRYGRAQERLLAAIAEQKPDLILMAGDMVDDKRPIRETERLFEGLRQYLVCYVAGNHESRRSDRAAVKAMARKRGVIVLTDEVQDLTIAGQLLLLGGIEDPENRRHSPAYDHKKVMAEAFGPVKDAPACRLLLAHKPHHMREYAQYGFDLVLSGHAHGGQVRVPGLLNGLFAPGQGLFPTLAGGVYQYEDTTLVVSRGLSKTIFPPRVFNRPEVVVIDLVK